MNDYSNKVFETKQEKKERLAKKRRRTIKQINSFIINTFLVLAISFGVFEFVLPMTKAPAAAGLEGPYKVVSITDGDTLSVEIDGEKKTVRLIGVDTPESVHPDADKNVPQGKTAADYTKELLDGKSVWLEYGVQDTDRYGRLLCYVYLDKNGNTMVQEKLLSDGMACVMTVQPNSEYADWFLKLQQTARKEGRGFWADGIFE